MNIRLLNNTVLVTLDDRPEYHYDSKGKKFLTAVHNLEHWKYSVSSGTVVAVCERLTKDYDFGTTVEIQVGDQIIFSYMAIDRDPHQSETITHDRKIGDDYIIRYNEVYCAVRNEEIIPVNGWVILEGMMEETKAEGIIIPEQYKETRSQIHCTIRHLGRPNTHYTSPMFKDLEPESDEWYEGQQVLIPKWKAVPLQNEEFSLIYLGLPLYRAQRKDLTEYQWAMESIHAWQKKHPPTTSEEGEKNRAAYRDFDKNKSENTEPQGKETRFFIHRKAKESYGRDPSKVYQS